MNENHQIQKDRVTRRFEPWPVAIVLFFLVVFIADAIMIFLSMDSWPGLVTKNHYQKGLEYNRVIDAQSIQDRLGWRIQVDSTPLAAEREGELSISLTDKSGDAVQHAQVEGILFRPLGEGHDVIFLLHESSPGNYSATITPPKPGVWDVKIRAKKTAYADFRYVERITVSAYEGNQGDE